VSLPVYKYRKSSRTRSTFSAAATTIGGLRAGTAAAGAATGTTTTIMGRASMVRASIIGAIGGKRQLIEGNESGRSTWLGARFTIPEAFAFSVAQQKK
jgi:hypothetical protein